MYTMTKGARLHFIKFETKHIEATLTYIQSCLIGTKPEILGKTHFNIWFYCFVKFKTKQEEALPVFSELPHWN
jgi:hypothetical protein